MSGAYGGDTAQGRAAYAVLDWAYEDPAGRVQEALGQVAELAREATDRALREVQSVGGMLARLAGTVSSRPELSGGIAAQVFDLASRNGHHIAGTPDTYRHGWQPLDPSASHALGAKGVRQRARKTATISQQVNAHIPVISAQIPAHTAADELHAQHLRDMQKVAQQVSELSAKIEDHKAAEEAARTAREAEEHRRHRHKLAVEAGVALGAGILGAIEAHFGAPDIVAIFTTVMGPALIQAFAEFKKRL